MMVRELELRYRRASRIPATRLSHPMGVAEFTRKVVWGDSVPTVEEAWVLLLDVKHGVINYQKVGQGTLTGCLLHPREVFRGAIVQGAAAIILVHNHPSGDTTPSAEDVGITKRLTEAGEIIGIRMIDHVIVSEESFTSIGELSR